MLLGCGVGEDSWESLGLQGTPESPLDCKEIQPVNPKGNQSWIFIRRTDAETKAQYFGHLMWKANTLEKTQCWERLKTGGEGDDRGWDGWMASLTRWMWVWVNSGNWWWTGRPRVLRFMGSQRVRHDWATELNWTEGVWEACEFFLCRRPTLGFPLFSIVGKRKL